MIVLPAHPAKPSFAPSSFDRWGTCPASVNLIADLPRQPSGEAAKRGKWAHEIAAKRLEKKPISILDFDFLLANADLDSAINFYTNTVETLLQATGGVLSVEVKVPMRLWKSVGYIDAVVTTPDHLHILDFKTGRFLIEAEKSTQMRIYAGTFLRENPAHRFEKVTVWIIQPSAGDGLTNYTAPPSEFEGWWELNLPPAHERALHADPDDRVASLNGCQFCPVRDPANGGCWAYDEFKAARKGNSQ